MSAVIMYLFVGFMLFFVSLSTQLSEFHGKRTEGHHRKSALNSTDHRGRKGKAGPDLTKCKFKGSLCDSVKQLSSINSFLLAVTRKYPKTTKLHVIGRTYRHQPIYSLEIFQGVDSMEFITVIVEFGIHGREWASQASGVYTINRLLEHERNFTKTVQWFILPLLNPDGYNHSVTEDNTWKKNRSPLNGPKACFGVDLNRNFDIGWELDSSGDPCKEDYAGSRPFSELESKALRRFIESLGPFAVDLYVAVHSCGQAILYPYGYTAKDLSEWKLAQLQDAGTIMAKAMKKLRNRNYDVDVAYKFGGFGGSTTDYMYNHFNIPFVYTLELGDRFYFEEYNFHHCYHPPSLMHMTYLNEECYEGLTALVAHLAAMKEIRKDRYYSPRSFNSFPSTTNTFLNLIASIILLL